MEPAAASSTRATLRLGSRGAGATLDPAALERELAALRSYRDTLHDTMKGLVAKASDKLCGEEGELLDKLEEVAAYLRNDRLAHAGSSQADRETLAAALQREAEATAALEEAREKAARGAGVARMHAAAAAKLAADWKAGREAYEAQLRDLRQRVAAAEQAATESQLGEAGRIRAHAESCKRWMVGAAMDLAGLERALVTEASSTLQLAASHSEQIAEARRAVAAGADAAAALEREEWESRLRGAEGMAEAERQRSKLMAKQLAVAESRCAAAERRSEDLERARAELSIAGDELRGTVALLEMQIKDLQWQLKELKLSAGLPAQPRERKPSRFVQYMAERQAVQEHALRVAQDAPPSSDKPAPHGAAPASSSAQPVARGRNGSNFDGAAQNTPTNSLGKNVLGGAPGSANASTLTTATKVGANHASNLLPSARQRGQMLLHSPTPAVSI
jgi:hypothetical protein